MNWPQLVICFPAGGAGQAAAEEFPPPSLGPSSQQWKEQGAKNNTSLIEKFYSDIPEDIMDKLKKIYRIDFEMFGYDVDNVS